MKKRQGRLRFFFLLLLAVSVGFGMPFGGQSEGEDLTSASVTIGNPLAATYRDGEAVYARNIWDMQLYDRRIFFGGGNSSNQGPASNAGPVPIIAYIPFGERFVTEDKVYDEQIDLYRVIGGKLYIPGHDAMQNWKWGNFYVRTRAGEWKMYRDVPRALHLYDMIEYGGKLLAGIGLYEGAALGVSGDGGKHWEIVPLGRSRLYAFMPVGEKLLLLKKFKRTDKPYFSAAQYFKDGTISARYDIGIRRIFPDTRFEKKYARAVRITPAGRETLYIGGYNYNDHQTLPFGLYAASMQGNRFSARKIPLPEGVVPRDILRRGDTYYLLTQQKASGGSRIGVWRASGRDLLRWKELFYFLYPTFARSFEFANGVFYFGMGCDVDPAHWRIEDLPKSTGDIVKIPYKEER